MRRPLVLLVLVGCASTPQRVAPSAAPPVAPESFQEAEARCRQALPGCADPTTAEEWSEPPPPPPCQGVHWARPPPAVKRMPWICVCRCETNTGCAADETCERRPLGYFEGLRTCGPATPADAGMVFSRSPEVPCSAP